MTADSAERKKALDVTRSFLVQAPAGSGKTELLTQRFLRLLETVDSPGVVMAITFTRRAAGEMRSRILDALRLARAGIAPDAEHQRATFDIAQRVLETDRRLQWDLLNNPSQLRVETIDAFCASITRAMPWLSRFGAMPEISEKAAGLYREAARNTLRRADSGDPALAYLLLHLDNNFYDAERLLVAMLERREQWLRHTGASPDLSQVRAHLENTLENVIVGHLRDVRRQVNDFTAAEIAYLWDLDRFPETNLEDLEQWQHVADLLLTRGNDWRKRADGFPKGDIRKARAEDLFARLSGNETLRAGLKLVRRLPARSYEDSQWQALEAAVSVLVLAVAELRMVFRERHRVDFAELGIRASAALGTPDLPTDLALSLGDRVQHLLVDEFQDTSFTQFELIKKLTAGWEPGDGRTLFLVGDPMQSIYRFRQADVGLFLKARENGIGAIRLEPLTLSVNFRSGTEIVDWVNGTFPEILREDNLEAGAVAYSPSVPGAVRQPAEVKIHAMAGAEEEAACVLELVQGSSGTTAILVRTRTHLSAMVAALKRGQIPFQAVEIDALGERPVVQDLMALTLALLHPADRVSWLAILRAPWCGLTLHDLHTLATADLHATLWDLLHRPGLQLSDDGAARVARILPILESARANRGRLPLRDWIETAWLGLGGPAAVSHFELSDAAAYFDLLERLGDGGDPDDFEWFRAQVNQLFAPVDSRASEGLQLMTIHKAKGLEFDTVILPSLGERAGSDESPLLVWLEQQGELLLAAKPEKGQDRGPIYAYIERVERRKAEHESARLLYVAATRARRSLHLIGSVRRKDDASIAEPVAGSFLKMLWPVVQEEFQRVGLDGAAVSDSMPRPIRRFASGWEMPSPPVSVQIAPAWTRLSRPDLVTPNWAGENARRVGVALHAFLQRIAQEGLAAWDVNRVESRQELYRAVLASHGLPPADLRMAAARVEAGLVSTLRDPRGRWILGAHDQAECEAPVAGLIDGSLVEIVCDRTFVDEAGVRWIIDYKTSEPDGDLETFLDEEKTRYQEQLERYARLLVQRDQRIIRLGLYFPLVGGWREWGAAVAGRKQATLFEL